VYSVKLEFALWWRAVSEKKLLPEMNTAATPAFVKPEAMLKA